MTDNQPTSLDEGYSVIFPDGSTQVGALGTDNDSRYVTIDGHSYALIGETNEVMADADGNPVHHGFAWIPHINYTSGGPELCYLPAGAQIYPTHELVDNKIVIQIAKIGIPAVRAVQAAEDFKSAMSQVLALSGSVENRVIEAMSDAVLRMATDAGESPANLANSLPQNEQRINEGE